MRRQTARIADPAFGLSILVERQRQQREKLYERRDHYETAIEALEEELARNERALAVLRGSQPALEMKP
jgi:alkylhydroperoxidase family enzyme